MNDYRQVIDRVNSVVNDCHKMKDLDGESMVKAMRDLSTAMYYLETVRSYYHNKFQTRLKELIDEGSSVSGAENKAHVEVPEMYELRRIMTAGYKVIESLRTAISYLKHEQSLDG